MSEVPITWMGTTYAEEHEIAPTFEVFLGRPGQCGLACPFCYQAVWRGEVHTLSVPRLLAVLGDPRTPPFRTLSFVGGEPTLHRPFLEAVLRRWSGETALNTNLDFDPSTARWAAGAFTWIIGDLHAWGEDCGLAVTGRADYPERGRRALGALLEAGAQGILRLLVLPGHVECCVRPALAWARALGVRTRLHLGYAPVGRVQGELARGLTQQEVAQALAMIPPDLPTVATSPLPGWPRRRSECVDAEAYVEVDATGRLFVPYVTGDLLPMVAAWDPSLEERLVYLEG